MSTRSVRLFFLALCILTSALISGFFYAYYCSVMPGLAATDPESAIRAMQGINAVVRNASFAFSFFGTLAFGVEHGLRESAALEQTGQGLFGRRALTAVQVLRCVFTPFTHAQRVQPQRVKAPRQRFAALAKRVHAGAAGDEQLLS